MLDVKAILLAIYNNSRGKGKKHLIRHQKQF